MNGMKSNFLKHVWQVVSKKRLGAGIVVVTVVGLNALVTSYAAAQNVGVEAESGTIGSNACVYSDPSASGGSAVKFGCSVGPACVTSDFNGYCPGPGQDYTDPNIYGSNGSDTYINTDVFSPVSNTS